MTGKFSWLLLAVFATAFKLNISKEYCAVNLCDTALLFIPEQ